MFTEANEKLSSGGEGRLTRGPNKKRPRWRFATAHGPRRTLCRGHAHLFVQKKRTCIAKRPLFLFSFGYTNRRVGPTAILCLSVSASFSLPLFSPSSLSLCLFLCLLSISNPPPLSVCLCLSLTFQTTTEPTTDNRQRQPKPKRQRPSTFHTCLARH